MVATSALGCGAKLYNPQEHYTPTVDEIYGHATLAKWDHNRKSGLIIVLIPYGDRKPTPEQIEEAAKIILDLCYPNNFNINQEGLDASGNRYMYHWWVYCEQ